MNPQQPNYPTQAQIYGLTYSVAYLKDVSMQRNTVATDTENHILWIYNRTDISAVESAIIRAEQQSKGSIDDYVATHHNGG